MGSWAWGTKEKTLPHGWFSPPLAPHVPGHIPLARLVPHLPVTCGLGSMFWCHSGACGLPRACTPCTERASWSNPRDAAAKASRMLRDQFIK